MRTIGFRGKHHSDEVDGPLFRAVVEQRRDGELVSTGFHGPYTSKRAAKSTLTRELGNANRWGGGALVSTGRVEQTTTSWEEVA